MKKIQEKSSTEISETAVFFGEDPKSFKFNEFKASPEQMPSKMLSNRLKKLEVLGFLCRKKGKINKKNVHYLLEDKGVETFPIMVEMAIFTTDFYYDHLGDTYTGIVKTRMKNDKENYIKEMMDGYRKFKETLVL